jgi:hypothetical protein
VSHCEKDGQVVHEWGCKCERCRCLIAAMLAQDSSGEYFFADDEIQELAEREP